MGLSSFRSMIGPERRDACLQPREASLCTVSTRDKSSPTAEQAFRNATRGRTYAEQTASAGRRPKNETTGLVVITPRMGVSAFFCGLDLHNARGLTSRLGLNMTQCAGPKKHLSPHLAQHSTAQHSTAQQTISSLHAGGNCHHRDQ